MDLKLKDKDILIEGIALLPFPYQLSLKKRGKTVINHRYAEDVKELQIFCSSCNHWHPVYRLENGEWVDINETYKLCNAGKEREYFDTYCMQCYSSKHKKEDTDITEKGAVEKTVAVRKEKVTKQGEEGQYLAWSLKNGGIQQTIALEPELDMYLKLYGVYHKKRKNQLLNEIIAEFKAKNPINL
ncbi:hypothetical protein HPT25_03840 [Bacillus sp. BRMEA1]|uniref:hypothetical protein n=1 Tax=Neobacillus endophyticus TaxID=2738405 RepID=UPI00156617A5|nr:hypothetical protein [Neobacillus endophyticus]NRD76622.1 hypothetical protein [Neobacillus endophyticus]